MTVQEALYDLGVRDDTLADTERETLDREGFLLLPGILSPTQTAILGARIAELLAEEGDRGGQELGCAVEPGTLADLVNKDPVFDICFTHPRVLAAVAHVLGGNLKLSSLNSRTALPGQGQQWLHADWEETVRPGNYLVCNSIWLLDAFTPENGPTRLVPGTHRSGKLPAEEMADPAGSHPEEVLLLSPAGAVGVFNAHVWHGGTLNRGKHPRRALHAYFCRRDQSQQQDQSQRIRPETLARLSPTARFLIDVALPD